MKRLLALLLACGLAGAAWAQKGLPTHSVPYSGGPGTQGWLSAGPCNPNQAIGYAITGGTPQCITVSGGTGGGGGGGINGISAGQTPTQGFGNTDLISSSGGVAFDTGISSGLVGTVQDIFAACAGTTLNGPIQQIGTIAIVDVENALNTTQPISAGVCGQTVRVSAGTNITLTIPGAGSTGYTAGTYFDFCNYSPNSATVATSAGTIGGAASVPLLGGTQANPYCFRVLYQTTNAWDLKWVTPTLSIGIISAGTTLIGNAASGNFLYVSAGVLQSQPNTFVLSAGVTPAQNFATNDLVSVSGGVVRDSGIPYTDVGRLSQNQTWAGANTYSGTFNASGTFQWHSETFLFPGANDTLAGLSAGNAFTGANTYAGPSTFNGIIIVGVNSTGSSTVNLTTSSKYFQCLNTTSNSITVNLPGSPTTGLSFLIKDCNGNAGSNAITIAPASGNIDGAGTAVINTNYQSLAVTYTGSQWSIN